MYCNETLKETMATLSRTAEKGKKALAALRDGARHNPTTFVMKMNFKVGAQKMASSLSESVLPRHTGNPADVDELQALIFKGISAKGAATKGTELQFDCSTEGVAVTVDGTDQGTVESAPLACAFCDVFMDDKTVSPALRQSCLDNCCGP
jgi:hypothetical protein